MKKNLIFSSVLLIFIVIINAQIRFPVESPPMRWNVVQVYDDPSSRASLELQWASIYSYAQDYRVIGDLAREEGNIDETGMIIEIELKHPELLRWSDSTRITIDDFRASFELFAGSIDRRRILNSSVYNEFGTKYDHCEYDTPRNILKIFLREPLRIYRGGHESIFEHIYIMPQKLISAARNLQQIDGQFMQDPISSGPYLLSEREQGVFYLFSMNKYYSLFIDHDETYVTDIQMTVDALKAAWPISLIGGSYEFLPEVHFLNVASIISVPTLSNRIVPRNHLCALVFNFNSTRLYGDLINQKNFRKAIARCINKDQLITSIFNSNQYAAAISGPFPPSYPAYNANVSSPQYSLDAARNLLAAIGLSPSGRDLTIQYNGAAIELRILHIVNEPISQAFFNNFEGDLEQIGIGLDNAALSRQSYENALEDGDFDIAYLDLTFSNTIPIDEFYYENGHYNYGEYLNYALNGQISRFLNQQLSLDDRVIAGQQVHTLVSEELPWIALWSVMQITAWNPAKIDNYYLDGADPFRYIEYWRKR
ncbi:MAG: hypothetical protein JXB49_01010 [Bacteroidales bacterium]|nr:hypothetical protein [Bacteroidales bacterium]